jgi:hypothetical protein
VAPTGLLAWWRAEADALDSIGANIGILRNGASFGVGEVGQAFSLDGIDDFVEIPHSASLNFGVGEFTVECWVNFNSTAGEQILMEKFATGTGPGWSFTKLADNRLVLGQGTIDLISGGLAIPPNSWHHFAARRSAAGAAIFMDGIIVASGAEALGSANVDSTASLKLGSRTANSFFLNGRIDEASIYNHALSDNEVASIYNAGIAGKCPPGMGQRPALEITQLQLGENSDLQGRGVEVPSREIVLSCRGRDGQRFVVQASADLIHWCDETATIDEVQAGVYQARVPASTNNHRFYRLRLLTSP